MSQSVPSLGGESYASYLKTYSQSGSMLRPRSDSQSGYKVTSLPGAKMPKMAWIDNDDSVNG